MQGKENVINIDSVIEKLVSSDSPQLERSAAVPKSPITIMYTSGSEGNPKGIQLQHRSLIRTFNGAIDRLELNSKDRFLFRTSICFVPSLYEVFLALALGSTICIAETEKQGDIDYLIDIINEKKLTFVNFVPSHFQQVYNRCITRKKTFPHVRRCVLAGEPLLQSIANNAMEIVGGKVINVYGSTEVVGPFTTYECRRDEEQLYVPIGTPFKGIDCYVFDNEWKYSDEGKLYVSTVELGTRYFNLDALNKERYIEVVDEYGKKLQLFDTNDSVRVSDGVYKYIGRTDNMLKINGLRIEAGEIEAIISMLESVFEAVVVAAGDKTKKLTCFVVSMDNEIYKQKFVKSIRAELLKKIQEYMIPTVWYVVDEIPKLPNGKVNRKFLSSINGGGVTVADDKSKPSGKVEVEVAAKWMELLKIDEIGTKGSFFEYGGDSLLLIQMINDLEKKYDIKLLVTEFINNPTIQNLANMIEVGEKREECYTSEPLPFEYGEELDLVEQQQAYYLGRQKGVRLSKVTTHGYVELIIHNFDENKFSVCIEWLVQEHIALRIGFTDSGKQYIRKKINVEHNVVNLAGQQQSSIDMFVKRSREEMNSIVLDLVKDNLFFYKILLLDNGQARVLFYFDSIIMDGKSMMVFINEFIKSYEQGIKPVQKKYTFYDFIKFREIERKSKKYYEDRSYWKNRIRNFPEPISLPVIKNETELGESLPVSKSFIVKDADWSDIVSNTRLTGLSEFIVMLTAVIKVMAKYTRRQKFLFCIPEFSRPSFDMDFEEMIGPFSNFLIFECESLSNEDFISAAQRYQRELWNCKQ